MKKNVDKWEIVSRFFVIVQFIVLFISLHFTTEQIKNSQNSTYMEYVLKFDTEFSEKKNHRIALAIEDNRPVLKANGGSFDEDDLGSYLDIYERLNEALQRNLIDKELIYNEFQDDLIATFKDQEIKNYIVKIRKIDPEYFDGFESLAKLFQNYHPTRK